MSYEARRYNDVDKFRVEAVEEAYYHRPEPLYRRPTPWQIDEGFRYSQASLPKGKFRTIEEALNAVRRVTYGSG